MKRSKNRRWYFVSYYEQRSVYVPEEGGYYYRYPELVEAYRVGSLKRARRLAARLAHECGFFSESRDLVIYNTDNELRNTGHFMATDRFIRVETVMGCKEIRRPWYQ